MQASSTSEPIERAARTSAFLGVAAALAVFLVGFCALLAFWLNGDYGFTNRGFFYYYAATWGDGLFLSVGAGGLVAWHHAHREAPVWKRSPIALALAFGLAGLFMQASWLADGDVTTNWTIPAAHRFNAAGWYHAAFFVCAMAFFGSSFVMYCSKRIRLEKHSGSQERLTSVGGLSEFAIWFAVSGYLVMHLRDDHPGLLSSPIGVAAPIAAVFFAAVVLIGISRLYDRHAAGAGNGGAWRASLAAVAASQACSLGVCASIVSGCPHDLSGWAFAVALAFVSTAAIAVDERAFAWRVACVSAAGFGTALAVGQVEDPAGGAAAAVAILLALSLYCLAVWCCQDDGTPDDDNRCIRGALLYIVTVVFAGVFLSDVGGPEDTATLLYTFALVVAAYYAKLAISPVQRAERRERERTGSGNRELVRNRTYGVLPFVVAGLSVLFLYQVASQYPSDITPAQAWGFLVDSLASSWRWAALACFAALCFAVAGLAAKGSRAGGVVQVVSLAVTFIAVFAFVLEGKDWLSLSPLLIGCYALAAILSCGMSAFVVESFISNTALIRAKPRSHDRRLMLEAAVLLAGDAAVCFVSIVPAAAAGDPSWKVVASALPGFVGIAVAFVGMSALVAGFSVWRGDNKPMKGRIVQNTPLGGVMQGGFSAWVVGMLFGIFALQMIMCLSVISGILTFLAAVLTAYVVMRFPFENNRRFLVESIEKAGRGDVLDEDPGETLRRLSRHLQRQPIFAAVGLLPWSLLYWLSAVVKSDEPAKDQLRRELLLRLEPDVVETLVLELLPGLASRTSLEDVAEDVLREQGWEKSITMEGRRNV